jgi:hypothetical protein
MDPTADIDRMVSSLLMITDQLRADAAAPRGSLHTIPLKDAAFIAGISEAQMRKRCEKHVYGITSGGYGRKRSSRWEVVFAPFVATLPVRALGRVNTLNRAYTRD